MASDPGPTGDGHDAAIRLVVAPAGGVFEPTITSGEVQRRAHIDVGQLVGTVTNTTGAVEVRSRFAGRLMGLRAHAGERLRPGDPVAWLQAGTSSDDLSASDAAHEPLAVRLGTERDAAAAARLHGLINDGFLASLGPRFLTLLYRRIARSDHSFLVVAGDANDTIGFLAATTDVRRLYREFVLRDGVRAGIVAAPRLVRQWRSMFETLSYRNRDNGPKLPPAEVLAIAVARHARGQGWGRRIVAAAREEYLRKGVSSARIVIAADNVASIRLHESMGFRQVATMEVHRGAPSVIATWSS